eukprot:CAMPEP_0177325426 /NCGR_PEP_ID=MMETSP0368-20130122/17797_1 /TAXON_ID=447022 ORGANISM="Scrippsiella hangoei-like, Strain SHHI-4" /NCGR_SAMPLE_ID=MMETSP0368 /ASSEMBLY_ACC=CAM_ASM_000363 /LENGTH=85 /DNA_ID=CAMNT_0018785313 /DNA_START=106 /DNA_END=359 /DNA_ORIENTATION=-
MASNVLPPSLHQRARAKGAANGLQPTQGRDSQKSWEAGKPASWRELPSLASDGQLLRLAHGASAVCPHRMARASLAEVLDTLFEL